MGNWLTLETLRQMAIRQGSIPSKIKTVMLASPDVDVDVFRTQLTAIGPHRPRLTLFVSNDDQALSVSRWVWGSTARLGTIDPRAEPYRTYMRDERIDVVDLSNVKSGDSLNHGKFADNPEVVTLIGRQLATGQPITDQQISLGERIGKVAQGAATLTGSAVAVAVTLPVAAVDPASRAAVEEELSVPQEQ
jgi:esterase/lipase superfamily enzyme